MSTLLAVMYFPYTFELFMISAKLHVFFDLVAFDTQVTKGCIISKKCFVARQQLAMSCGKKTNLGQIFPCSSAGGHDDPQICGCKINFPICSLAYLLWPQ